MLIIVVIEDRVTEMSHLYSAQKKDSDVIETVLPEITTFLGNMDSKFINNSLAADNKGRS